MDDEEETPQKPYTTLDFLGDVCEAVTEAIVIEAAVEILATSASVLGEVAVSVIDGIVNSDS